MFDATDSDEEPKYLGLADINILPSERNGLINDINSALSHYRLEEVKGFHYRMEDNDISWVTKEDLDTFYEQISYDNSVTRVMV